MKGTKAVVGVFSYMDDALRAVQGAQHEKLDFRVYSPVPRHEIDHVASPERSSVRMFTTVGASIGIVFGFALAILCSLDWPLRVSAKDIISIPGFVVIGYECTILFGAIFTLVGLLHFCRIPDVLRKVGYDPRFTEDKFGVVIGCDSEAVDLASSVLKKNGAEEVMLREGM
jgi:hypothetical protein